MHESDDDLGITEIEPAEAPELVMAAGLLLGVAIGMLFAYWGLTK